MEGKKEDGAEEGARERCLHVVAREEGEEEKAEKMRSEEGKERLSLLGSVATGGAQSLCFWVCVSSRS